MHIPIRARIKEATQVQPCRPGHTTPQLSSRTVWAEPMPTHPKCLAVPTLLTPFHPHILTLAAGAPAFSAAAPHTLSACFIQTAHFATHSGCAPSPSPLRLCPLPLPTRLSPLAPPPQHHSPTMASLHATYLTHPALLRVPPPPPLPRPRQVVAPGAPTSTLAMPLAMRNAAAQLGRPCFATRQVGRPACEVVGDHVPG